ncbi:MAG TPA: gamma-glutamyltransferase family protein [Chloroflexota bacterium]|jgi:gamma-glutamyltranspeptidase/glutathione hydrolase|nr:gamma-glutamyltransferase family protein [Chloroflexota bacterium]
MATRKPAGGSDLFQGPRATRRPPVQAREHAVVAGHPLAALAAQRILDRGGNAADAGVAAGICTGVLLPDLVSLGGVAPIVYYDRRADAVVTISGLGRWPRAASPEAVRDPQTGQMARDLRCCVVPAAVDAWLLALERYGTMRLADVAADAIGLCERGFPVYDVLAGSITLHGAKLASRPSSAAVFMPGGRPLGVGDLLVQPDLGRTLRRLVEAEAAGAAGGRQAGLRAARDLFYRGEIAEEVARFSRQNGGLLSYQDLAGFSVKVEPPTRTTYRGYELFGCGPWCQGPTLPIALNVLEGYDLAALGHNSPAYLHLLTEALKAAFSDREHYVADPEFVDVPLDDLLSKERAARWRERIDPRRAWPELPPRLPAGDGAGGPGPRAQPAAAVPPDTSYVCVVDRHGDVFSATPSDGFTEVPVAPGLGFVVSPRGTQSWLDPDHPACVAPGKRPRLTPAPFILFRDGRPVMPFGTPGADVQPQAMLQFVLNVVEFGMDPQAAAEAPRLATYSMPITADPHPCRPNLLRLEERAGASAFDGLAALGHDVQPWPDWHPAAGSVCAIWIDHGRGTLTAGADPRRVAYALGW